MKNKIYNYLFSFLATAGAGIKAQIIHLEFPYFAGKMYEFKIVQGEKHVVLQNDTIPKGGKIQLTIPEKYKGYKGMAMWYLTNSKEGGGLEMVINKEDFSVSCLDSIPTTENIVYQNTQENNFLNSNYQEQQAILVQHDAMLYAKRAYPTSHELYPIFEKEYNRILMDYSNYMIKLKATPLYAARFREITNLTLGLGTIITEDEQIKAKDINAILVHQLNYEELYTSNHWSGIINSFVQLHTKVLKEDTNFIADATTILKRISNHQVYTDFVVNLTKELTKAGKDNIITALAHEIKKSNKLVSYFGVLSIYQQDLSGKAPKLEIREHFDTKNGPSNKIKTIDLAHQKSKYTLLVFYQSGCGYCEELMQGLQRYYKEISLNEVKIISLSADTDEQVFKSTSYSYPWNEKYCDLQGMNGINFKNYGVIGTPTLYLINNKGVVVEKLSGMEGLKKTLGLQ